LVYLIHFHAPLLNSRHYVGWVSSPDGYEARMAEHKRGAGAKILAELVRRGIGWDVVRVWPEGDRKLERRIKNHKNIPLYYCPLCMEARTERRNVARRARRAEARARRAVADV
jgi:hypothetical protein